MRCDVATEGINSAADWPGRTHTYDAALLMDGMQYTVAGHGPPDLGYNGSHYGEHKRAGNNQYRKLDQPTEWVTRVDRAVTPPETPNIIPAEDYTDNKTHGHGRRPYLSMVATEEVIDPGQATNHQTNHDEEEFTKEQ